MRKLMLFLILALFVLTVVCVAGCAKKQPTPTGTTAREMTPSSEAGRQAPANTNAVKPQGSKPAADMAVCVVDGMHVAKNQMKTYTYKGNTYYFCSAGHVERFKQDPAKYLKANGEPKNGGTMVPAGKTPSSTNNM